ncbi:MAG TPA: MFS transporter, partial [Ilumatobacteraceae bacterium]
LLYGIIEGPAKGWSDTAVVAGFVVGVSALLGFVMWELRSSHPMLDVHVFKNPRFTAASSTITITFFALFGSLFLMTQYWQLVHGYSPLEAGIRLLPHALTMMIMAPLSARFVERFGTKRVVTTGLCLIATGLFLLSTIEPQSPYPVVISFFVVMASGMAMTMAPATESVMGSLPRSKAGVGSAVNDTTRQVGGALGVAVIGSVVSSLYAASVADSGPSFGLSASELDKAESSLGGALAIAPSLGDEARSFVDTVNNAFVDSLSAGLRISMVFILGAAVLTWRFLPAREKSHGDETAEELADEPFVDTAITAAVAAD